MFVFQAKLQGGVMDGAIYESDDAHAIAVALISDAGMHTVKVADGKGAWMVPNADWLGRWIVAAKDVGESTLVVVGEIPEQPDAFRAEVKFVDDPKYGTWTDADRIGA